MNVLSLFSGIGGMDLGLDRAGFAIAGQVEIDPWCRKVLAKHWPEVPRHDDVRTAAEWWGGRRAPDLVCGGFPCQPVSVAGRGLAQADERWLWPAFADVIRALRPRFVFMENVPGLLGRGMGDVLGDLASLGYDAEWDCLSAADFGAPHLRERIWLVAYPAGTGYAPVSGRLHGDEAAHRAHVGQLPGCSGAHAGLDWRRPERGAQWRVEPLVGRMAHGLPGQLDRLRGLGNAVVPQVAEHIGRLILRGERAA